jgi:hypothetical protein
MQWNWRSRLTYANAMSSLALFVALGGGAYAAAAPAHVGAIRGCVSQSGRLLVLRKGQHCKASETNLTWQQQGPRGPAGAVGPAGATGPQGNAGTPVGSTGPAGGALTGTIPDPTIAASAVTSSDIAGGSVDQTKLDMTSLTEEVNWGDVFANSCVDVTDAVADIETGDIPLVYPATASSLPRGLLISPMGTLTGAIQFTVCDVTSAAIDAGPIDLVLAGIH